MDVDRRLRVATGVALLLTALAVGVCGDVARAQDDDSGAVAEIAGSDLTVWAGDRGTLQARLPGRAHNTFYDPWFDHGDAGLFVGVTDSPDAEVDGMVFGPPMSASYPSDRHWDAESLEPASGAGTESDPFRQVTRYTAEVAGARVLGVAQTIEHVSGQTAFRVSYAVRNASGLPLAFRASTAADVYAEDDDSGTGTLVAGPPRFVGGVNPDAGLAAGIEEDPATPFDHFQVGAYYRIFDAIEDLDGSGFDDTVIDRYTDNGVGVQWDDHVGTPLEPGETATFSLRWRFAAPAPLWLTPMRASLELGDTHAVSVRAFDDAGDPYDGRVLRWSIGGANPAAGSATIGPDGRAEISWSGDRAGRDELTVYLDLDGDDRRDSGEPQAVVAATFVAPAGGGATTPPPPTPTTPPAPPAPPTSKPTPPTPTPTPTPPPPPTPMAPTLPDTTAPAGRLLRPRRLRGRTIARSGLRTTVAASEPVTVRQHLYRDMGAPGRAARARVRPKLLGRAVAQLREAGSASVELRLTARGRRTLRRQSTVHVLLQTSLTDHAGNTTRLPHRWLRIRH